LPWQGLRPLDPAPCDPDFPQSAPHFLLCNSCFDRPWLWNGSAAFEKHSNQTAPCLMEVCEGLFG
jgi:hypothetical protein